MCGRLIHHSQAELFMNLLEPGWSAPEGMERPPPTWNLAPSRKAWVVVSENHGMVLERQTWGFRPSWAKPGAPSPINARAETAADKPYFREAWRRSRCLVPADGYYEWQRTDGSSQPFMIGRTEGRPMLLAGLHTAVGFAVVTVAAGKTTDIVALLFT